MVVEKDSRLGGSGALSAGILWTAPDRETLRRVMSARRPRVGRALVDDDAAVERVRDAGVDVSERWEGQMGFGVAHRIDIAAWLEAARERIEQGGRIAFQHAATDLIVDGDEVRGARVSGPAGDEEITAGAVLLATGGFQGDARLVRRLIGEGRAHALRANPHSVGDGLRMGQAAGAAPSGALDSFYGHLLPSPLNSSEPGTICPHPIPLACVRGGEQVRPPIRGRVRGDEVTNQALLRQAGSRGVLLCDERCGWSMRLARRTRTVRSSIASRPRGSGARVRPRTPWMSSSRWLTAGG